ncbi:membrane protein [Flavobacterium sp. JRM]|nr:membrane protein [Flavobacterium sp. JRM]
MKKIVTSALLLIGAIAFAQKPIFTTAKVKAATVYFNAAEISQTASANLPLGTSEIVIKNVAVDLNENSIQIGTPSTVTVLSVQFTNNYISEYEVDTKSPALKRVRDSIVLVQKELQKVNNTINSETKTIQLLDKNQQISGVNSGLNVTELMKMVEYYKNKQIEIANTINTLTEKQQKLNETLQKLNNKLEVDTSKEEKTSSGKLIVQVMNEVAGAVPLDISYLTNNATWTPFYDLRAESVTSPINMMYKAQVIQNTGIDWKKVKLTLSSGYPNQNNQAPILSSWFLRNNNIIQAAYGYKQKGVMNQLQGRVAGVAINDDASANMEIAAAPSPVITESSVSNYTTVEENQLNVSFDIDIPYDILSNGKVHSVSLKEIKLPSSYKYYAAPRVENEAFLLAEIADYSKYNLLRGEANIIFEGMYVGKTFIEPNQTSDTLNLSMGRDKKVSIKREKVADKSGTKFLSSKKEQTFTYDITVRNNKKEAIELLLKDQYPLTTNKEIEVELLQNDGAKVNSETGILTWQLQMKPNEIKKFRISYKVRYPKDQVLNL